jgi:hypothetical protein
MTKPACLLLLVSLLVSLLAGCAAGKAPATVAAPAAFAAIVPGQTGAAELRARLGPTREVAFDNGYRAWLYVAPAGGGRYTEMVVLTGPDGVVRKTRTRVPP